MEPQMKALWASYFEKAWNSFQTEKLIFANSQGETDYRNISQELMIHHLMIHSVSSYMTSQNDRIKVLETSVSQTPVKVLSPSSKYNAEKSQIFTPKSPFITPKKLISIDSTNSSPSSEESFSSPSLFSNPERRKSPRFKAKENSSPINETVSSCKVTEEDMSQKSPILKQHARLKQSKLIVKHEVKDSYDDKTKEKVKVRAKLDFKPILETTKSSARQPVTSLSRKPKLRQTTLDTKLVEQYEMTDVTKSEEFKGGFRVPQEPGNSKHRKEIQKNDQVSNISKSQSLRLASTSSAMNTSSSRATESDGFGNFSDDDVDLDATCFIPSTPAKVPAKPMEDMPVLSASSPRKRLRSRDDCEDDDEWKRKVGDDTMKLIQEFDRLPKDHSNSPGYAFKDRPIRTKAGKINSLGTTCAQCKEYYEEIASQLNTQDLEKIINKCSRHRTNRRVELQSTPPDYWRSDIPSTAECIEKGLLQVESQPYVRQPRQKARHRMY